MRIRITALLAAAVMAVMSISAAPQVLADKWVLGDTGYKYEYDNGTTASKGWLYADGSTYYIQKDGTRKTGWLKASGNAKYYFGKDGAMYRSRWVKFSDGSRYYFGSNGKAASGICEIDGKEYKFADDGRSLGENQHFILNKGSSCLHSDPRCRAAKKISKSNYSEIDIGTEENKAYSKDGYWACGVSGCNSSDVLAAFPKPAKGR